jgi:radical SAM superfamily enzyme YgiQ (UPF0313 family)
VSHAQLTACVRKWVPGADVRVLDCRALSLNAQGMIAAIQDINPDLIYMGDAYQMTETIAIVPHYQNAARLIKKTRPDTPICVGGFYIAANYQSVAAETPEFDFLIAGEPEMTITELCRELSKPNPDLASVKGLLYRRNGAIQLNEYRPLMKNLDELPMPAYDLFPMEKYQGWSTLNHYQEIFTSRGCPFGCSFCIDWVTMDPRGNRDWQRYRTKSASRVVDEMELLEKKYGVTYVSIFDLNFNPKRSRVEAFLKEMQNRKLNIRYCFLGNAHSFVRDRDLLEDLHKTGFVSGVFGLEVADEDELKKMNKGITVDEVREVTEQFRKIGITSIITWMIGFPDDDETIIKKRFQALDEIDPDVSSLQMLLPVPGMPMYEEWKQYIEETDLKKWDFHQPVVRTKHLTREELGELAVWANREFYTKKDRIDRVLSSTVLHPDSKAIFRTYIAGMDEYAKKATGKQVA